MKKFLLDGKQCREVDHLTLESGLSESQLMGQAALSAYYQLHLEGFLPLPHPKPLILLCGSGNNGGDGLALAWFLSNSYRHYIKIYCHKDPHTTKSSQAFQLYSHLCEQADLSREKLENFLLEKIPPGSIIIDALLGIRGRNPLPSLYVDIIKKISHRKVRPYLTLISLDTPTGLSEEGPRVGGHEIFFNPDRVYSFGTWKLTTALCPQIPLSKVKLLPMGFSREVTSAVIKKSTLTPPILLSIPKGISLDSFFRKRPEHHKYQAGAGMVLGGHPGMEGALILASKAFFAAGGGLCVSVVPEEKTRALIIKADPGLITSSLSGLAIDSAVNFKNLKGVVLGPGLGEVLGEVSSSIKKNFLTLIEKIQHELHQRKNFFVILDAGFLTYHSALLSTFQGPRVLLTPHRGELQRLGFHFQGTAAEVPSLRQFVKEKLKCWVLVKDAVTLLCGPQGECFVWHPQAPHLAVAGSGDVLCGILLAACVRQKNGPLGFEDIVPQALALHALSVSPPLSPHPRAMELIAGVSRLLQEELQEV